MWLGASKYHIRKVRIYDVFSFRPFDDGKGDQKTYLAAKPLSWHCARWWEYWHFLMTSGLRISSRIRRIASWVNRGNGSETAIGEIPVCSDRPISFIVCTLEGRLKVRCFSGSNSHLVCLSSAPFVIGWHESLDSISWKDSGVTIVDISVWIAREAQEIWGQKFGVIMENIGMV